MLLAFVFGYGLTLLPRARAAFPVDRRPVAAGRGHAVVHGRHGGDR